MLFWSTCIFSPILWSVLCYHLKCSMRCPISLKDTWKASVIFFMCHSRHVLRCNTTIENVQPSFGDVAWKMDSGMKNDFSCFKSPVVVQKCCNGLSGLLSKRSPRDNRLNRVGVLVMGGALGMPSHSVKAIQSVHLSPWLRFISMFSRLAVA